MPLSGVDIEALFAEALFADDSSDDEDGGGGDDDAAEEVAHRGEEANKEAR